MALWNIYCQDEKLILQTWRTPESPPTVCPNNPHHIINPASVNIERLSRIRLSNGTVVTTNSGNYTPLMNYITQGSDILQYDDTYAIAVKIVASVDCGSYDYCFVTVPDGIILYECIGNTNTVPTIVTIPITSFSNIPQTETSIDVRFRTSGGTLTLRNISIYYTVSV